MHTLPRPTDLAVTVFRACIRNVQSEKLRERLESVSNLIARAENEFTVAAEEKRLYTLRPAAAVGSVSVNEMVDVHDNRLVKKGGPGRRFYDKLKVGAKGGKCPLCGHRTASTLDHYLPKTRYPSLAVTPVNLIPACMECNYVKRNEIPHSDSEQTLHAYFDDVEGDPWLVATLIETTPATVTFSVRTDENRDARMASRVKYHFNLFKLGELYAMQAADELAGIDHQMSTLRQVAGPDAVRSHLRDAGDSRRRYRINGWQTAFYEALAASDWYCQTVGS